MLIISIKNEMCKVSLILIMCHLSVKSLRLLVIIFSNTHTHSFFLCYTTGVCVCPALPIRQIWHQLQQGLLMP